MAAVEEGGLRPGGLGDAVRHQVVGELDVEDRGDALALHLLRQEGHGGGGGLRLGGTAGEGGVAGEAVGLGEVAQGEAVAEDQGLRGEGREEVPELPVQGVDLRLIGVGGGKVALGVGAVQRRHPLRDGPGDPAGVLRGGPDVLVDLVDLPQSVAVVVMVLVVLLMVVVMALGCHALQGLLVQGVHAVDHPQSLRRALQGGEDGLHPGVGLAAEVDEEAAVLHRQDVPGGGLVGVALRPGGQEQGDLRRLAADGAGQVIGREAGGHDGKAPGLPVRHAGPGGAARQQGAEKSQAQQGGKQSLHGMAPLNLRIILTEYSTSFPKKQGREGFSSRPCAFYAGTTVIATVFAARSTV